MSSDPIEDVVGPVIQRTPLGDAAEKFSSADIERIETADGRRYVVKYLSPQGDWLTRGTDGSGRVRRLWDDGLFDRLSSTVDHGVEALVTTGRGDALVMRDLHGSLLPSGTDIRRDVVRGLLGGLTTMHGAWEGFDGSYCPVERRLDLFAPDRHRDDPGPYPHPIRDLIVDGWTVFADTVPADIAGAVFAVHENPLPLARRLMAAAPPTLVHGDAKPENLGFSDRLVAVDWGELTGSGPAEVDVAWFAVQATFRTELMPSEVFAAYDEMAGEAAARRLDRDALDAACIGSLAQMGFKLALRAERAPDPAMRSRSRLLCDWWVTRAAEALARQ